MADVKISALPSGTTPTGTEIIPAVQGGVTVGLTVNQITPIKSFNSRIGAVVPASGDYSFSQISGTVTNSQLAGGIDLTSKVTGILPVANGGSGSSSPSLVAGTNVTISGTWPNQTINSTAGGGGSVTSVGVSVPSFMSVAGSPVTSSGTIAVGLNNPTANTHLKADGTNLSYADFAQDARAATAYFPYDAAINYLGDSYSLSNQATNVLRGFVSLFARSVSTGSTGTGYNNYAVSGTGALQGIRQSYVNITTGNNNPMVWTLGFNDKRRGGLNSKTDEKLKSGLRAAIANARLVSAIAANNVAVSTTGTWSTTSGIFDKASLSLSGLVRTSTTTGSTLSYTFTLAKNQALVIGTYSTDEVTTTGGDFTYAIDGGSAITYSGKNKTDGISDGTYDNSLCPNAIIIQGLSAGSHTVVITTLSTATVRIDYFGILADPTYWNPIIVNAIPKMNATGYAIAPANGSDAAFDAGDAALLSVVNEFKTGGNNSSNLTYPIYFNQVNNYFNVSTDVAADNIHPNDLGYFHIFQSMMALVKPQKNPASTVTGYQSDNIIYFANRSTDFQISTNRNPYNNAFFNSSLPASAIQMTYASGVTAINFSTSNTNNSNLITTNTGLNISGTQNVTVGPGASANTSAWLNIIGGTSTTAALNFFNGSGLIGSASQGKMEVGTGGDLHYSPQANMRFAVGGPIREFNTDAGNTGSTETDLYTYTTVANTLNQTNEKIKFEVTGNVVGSATATRAINVYFAGTNIFAATGLTISSNTSFEMIARVVRTGSTTARASVRVTGISGITNPVVETDLTGLTFSGTNIIKITGTSSGTGSASNDIVAKMGTLYWWSFGN